MKYASLAVLWPVAWIAESPAPPWTNDFRSGQRVPRVCRLAAEQKLNTKRRLASEEQDNLPFFSLETPIFFSVPCPFSREYACAWDASIIPIDCVCVETILVSLRDADCLGPRDKFIKYGTRVGEFFHACRLILSLVTERQFLQWPVWFYSRRTVPVNNLNFPTLTCQFILFLLLTLSEFEISPSTLLI